MNLKNFLIILFLLPVDMKMMGPFYSYRRSSETIKKKGNKNHNQFPESSPEPTLITYVFPYTPKD